MALLDIEDLRLSFYTKRGIVSVLRGVSLSINEGEVLGIVGESGSGKSLTAYSVLGLLPPNAHIDGGSVRFKGEDILNADKRRLNAIRGNRISIIFQDPMTSLNPTERIGRQITESLLLHTDASKAEANLRAIDMLKAVGIRSAEDRMHQYPHELSGGMRQRVMIAMSLACDPDLLIADEPTPALDVTVAEEILDLLKMLGRERRMAIMMITHDLGTVASICDEVAVMYGGRIVERGRTEDIFYSAEHEYTRALLNSVPSLDRKKQLVPIGGSPIDLSCVNDGCPFAPRCASAMRICLKKYPDSFIISNTHTAACYAYPKRRAAEAEE